MLTSVRGFAQKRIKPVVGTRGWRLVRKLDGRGERARSRSAEREAQDAEISRAVRAGVEQALCERSRQTLTVRGRERQLTAAQLLSLQDVDAFLSAKPEARVALLGGPETATLADLISARFPGCTVVEVPASSTESERHVRLAATGRHHLILATGRHEAPAELVTNVLFHLRRNGLLVITDLDPAQPAPDGLLPLLTRLVGLHALQGTPEGRGADKDERALVRAIRRIVISDGYAVVENRTELLAKIGEQEVGLLLELREPAFGQVLERRPAETFLPDCVIRDHAAGSGSATERPSASYEVPALELREYSDVTCAIGQVLLKDHLLLPDTYRHNQRPRLKSRKIEDLAPRFGRLRVPPPKLTEVSGTYFYWDDEHPGHFGHMLTEQLSRVWALAAARERHPDLKVIFGRRYGHKRPLPFEVTMLAAVGFEESQIQLNLRSAQVERVLAATPMLSMPEYVSPQIAGTWDLVGDRLASATTLTAAPSRIFCSRRSRDNKRSCRNAPEVEQLFASYGFDIVFPEELSMADQIVTFRNADIVAGFAGSALFNLMFCSEPKQVIILASETYTATNEYLIGAVRQHEFDVFWSRADDAEFQSDFVVDLDQEGRLLSRHLSSLA